MKNSNHLLALFLVSIVSLSMQAQTPTIGLLSYQPWATFEGYNLHFPHNQGNVWLLDNCGQIVHVWEDLNYKPGNGVYLTEDGKLYVAKGLSAISNPDLHAGGGGEKIEIRSWDNTLEWEWTLNTTTERLHHDIAVMPNGNILAIAWEVKDSLEAIQAGRNPLLIQESELWPDQILEIEPVGSDEANIVWEWHAWDHLIQDFDPTKDNFGVIADNPRKLNINMDEGGGRADWMHANSIDYNPDLDQIILSVPFFDEVYIIDHSTTTAQAAGSTGGLSGHGGDLLWRWGNPANYGQGDTTDQKLFFNHDSHWTRLGMTSSSPDWNKIAVFNNKAGADFSTVHLLSPTFDSYEWEYPLDGDVFGPVDFSWSYQRPTPQDLYSSGLSSIQRLPNGNTLICAGRFGYSFEIDDAEEIVWEYRNPLQGGNPVDQGTTLAMNDNLQFRMTRYPSDFAAFDGRDLTPLGYIELNPTTDCEALTGIDDLHAFEASSIAPNPASGRTVLNLIGLEAGTPVEVIDLNGRRVWAEKWTGNPRILDLSSWTPGIYLIKVEGMAAGKLLVQ